MQKQFSSTVLVAAAVAGIGAAATGAQPGLAASPQAWRVQLATDPTGAVGLAASTLLWLLIGLVAVGVIATVLGRLPGAAGACCDALSQRLLPSVLRRALHLMIGVTVGVTALAPSGAWAADAAFARPLVSISTSAPADSLPNPLPSLGEPGGPVTMPTVSAPPPQVAPTPRGTPGTAVATSAPGSPTPGSPTGSPTPGSPTGSPTPTTAGSSVPSAPAAASSPSAPGATAAPSSPAAPPSAAAGPSPGTAPPATAAPGTTAPGTTAPAPQPSASPTRRAAARPAVSQAVPSAAAMPPGIDPTMAGAFGATSAATVSVVPGDSLWVLAARDLARRDAGATPGDAAIAAEWPRWWAANRAAIGADPNLLTPGQRLSPPA